MAKMLLYAIAASVVATATFCLATLYAGRLLQVGQIVMREDTTWCTPDDPQAAEEAVPTMRQVPLPLFHDGPEKGDYHFDSSRPLDNQVIQMVREQLPPIPFEDAEEPPLTEEPAVAAPPRIDDRSSEPPLSPEPLIFPATSTPADIEEEQKMPRCYEDEPDAPSRMPGAEDAEATGSTDALFRFWLDLFREANEESGGVEESEALYEEVLPPCQEDPAYQYQYPGCPFTGKNPLENRSARKLSMPIHETKQKKESMVPDFDPDSLQVPERLKRLLPQAGSEGEELLPPPNVDTTEFRPSDAKPGEFDPQPM